MAIQRHTKKQNPPCTMSSSSQTLIVGNCAVLIVRSEIACAAIEAGSPHHKTIVVFCGKDADCFNAVPSHGVTNEAVKAALETSNTYIFVGMLADAAEFSQRTCTMAYRKSRTQSMIKAVKTLGISPNTIKLFSYGASFPDIVSASFAYDVCFDIYGSGESFDKDITGVSQKYVRSFKSTGDQYSQFGSDDDKPSPVVKFDGAALYHRAPLRDFEDGPLGLIKDGNFLIIQQDRATVIQQKRYGDLLCTHADLGGEFLVKV